MANTPRDTIDLVARDMARAAPLGFCGLAGIPLQASQIRFEDTSVIIYELQADKVLVVAQNPAFAFYPEFQKKPADEETMRGWAGKQIALTRRLEMPVGLVVFYLHRGDRATFPNQLVLGPPGLPSIFSFPTVLLWEKEDEIRQHYPDLAPLLLITAQEPTEATLREVKALIDGLEETPEKRDNLYGLTAMLGTHYFEEALVQAVFGSKYEEIKKMGMIDRWLDEKYQEGISQGISQGVDQGARQLTLRLLMKKFGAVPGPMAEQIGKAPADWLDQFTEQILTANSLEELDLSLARSATRPATRMGLVAIRSGIGQNHDSAYSWPF